ncbi:hypothetical protein MCOR23_001149 [Pyricularia oryzae]|nr:hypothetical protein MCOR23_001149 [Pyricularia oryzae]KAI6416301.1 hypothetical protein MCOR24_005966 [Pyricularia oryzae]KAI6604794.1 hypothetical protein MCOR04_001325 [Pyricularia oryzae]KAI6639555.1 hypothetical protein MCOR08_002088 [Pyricularia oryzae]
MPVPFETLIPYAIITAMFGISGAGISTVRWYTNGGKRPRRSIDQWDRQSTGNPTVDKHSDIPTVF